MRVHTCTVLVYQLLVASSLSPAMFWYLPTCKYMSTMYTKQKRVDILYI